MNQTVADGERLVVAVRETVAEGERLMLSYNRRFLTVKGWCCLTIDGF